MSFVSGASATRRLVLGAALTLAGCDPAPEPPMDPVFVPVPGNSSLPFSAAVRVGDMLYLSGQIGTDSAGALVKGGIEPETRQTMENIRAVLKANGSSMNRVVKCLVMLADMAEWGMRIRRSATCGFLPLPGTRTYQAPGAWCWLASSKVPPTSRTACWRS